MQDKTIKIDLEIDLEKLKETIENALDLNDNQQLFEQLIEFERVKKQVSDIMDSIKSIEADAKGLIASKANALYTDKWEAIKGQNYKITKSPTGSVFEIDGEPAEEFIVIKKTANTKAVNQYIKDNGKLPDGLQYNASRNTSIRININDENS